MIRIWPNPGPSTQPTEQCIKPWCVCLGAGEALPRLAAEEHGRGNGASHQVPFIIFIQGYIFCRLLSSAGMAAEGKT